MDPEFYEQMKAQGNFKTNAIRTPLCDSDTPKGKENESFTGASEGDFLSADAENGQNNTNEPLEVFSFFKRGDQSKHPDRTGNIKQLHDGLTSFKGWKAKIEHLRTLEGKAQSEEKGRLPAFTPSVCITCEKRKNGKDIGGFKHTGLIQADFDESGDFGKLFELLCRDPHVRLVFRSPRGKVKALIKVKPVENASDHKHAFETVRVYCRARGYGEIDGRPKNINCLCFISYDPYAVLKDATPIHWVPPAQQEKPTRTTPSEYDGEPADLTEWLKANGVIIRGTRNHDGNLMYLVDCPWGSEHTQDFGHKDTAVFIDPTDDKWCFNCFHDHCEHREWKDYREKVAPKKNYTPPQGRNSATAEQRHLRREQYGYERF